MSTVSKQPSIHRSLLLLALVREAPDDQIRASSAMLRFLIHLELSFVQGEKYGCVYILLHVATQFDQDHLLKMLSFLQCLFLTSLSKIMCLWVCGLCLGGHVASCL